MISSNRLIHKGTILRKSKIEGKGMTSQFRTLKENVPCLVIPTNPKEALSRGLSVGKEYAVFLNENEDIKKGDRIEALGFNLSVSGVAYYKNIPRIGHIHALCETIE